MDVTYFGALLAGFLSFLSPCVLPLVPPYLCFLGGTTFDQLAGEDETPKHVYTTVVLSSIAFLIASRSFGGTMTVCSVTDSGIPFAIILPSFGTHISTTS